MKFAINTVKFESQSMGDQCDIFARCHHLKPLWLKAISTQHKRGGVLRKVVHILHTKMIHSINVVAVKSNK